ncbi:hypothetical protein, partial [Escherichia coli]|uniref:hypothetical protein n=1 Tax=Escherichia coli TaxID=562 RepID=UPI0032DB715A
MTNVDRIRSSAALNYLHGDFQHWNFIGFVVPNHCEDENNDLCRKEAKAETKNFIETKTKQNSEAPTKKHFWQ